MTKEEIKLAIMAMLDGTDYYRRVSRLMLAKEIETDDRAIRLSIHELRREGHWICTDTEFGGFYIGTAIQWDSFCEQQRRRAINNFYRKSNEPDERQIRIVVE